ncbi:hypothetical protein [Rhizobium ruizarguesonis]|uniref:hypothetical protein n=1 Tax=Rhizobium ruizarguesonis TaxID=2081791 RepID=UPI00103218A4|nr:hypothetical protein [Rhizobium ruizarguesonis]TAY62729.1 hypothetical protein ELH86_37530 [Rhizobium ruizarguesonis]
MLGQFSQQAHRRRAQFAMVAGEDVGLSQIFPLNPMLTIRREFAAPKVAERTDDSECHCRKAEAPVEA